MVMASIAMLVDQRSGPIQKRMGFSVATHDLWNLMTTGLGRILYWDKRCAGEFFSTLLFVVFQETTGSNDSLLRWQCPDLEVLKDARVTIFSSEFNMN